VDRLSLALALTAIMGLVLSVPLAAQDATDDESATDDSGNRIILSLGTFRPAIDGNSLRFRQYVTPPDATYLSGIEIIHPLDEHGRSFGGTIRNLTESPAGADLFLYDADVGLRLDGQYRRSEFFKTFYSGADELRRKDWRIDARWRATTNDHLIFSASQVDMQSPSGDPTDNWTSQRVGLRYTREIGRYEVAGSASNEQFNFSARQPHFDGDTTVYGLTVEPARDGRMLFAGNVTTSSTDLVGHTRSPRETAASITGYREIDEDLSVTGDLRYWELDNTIAVNSQAQEERSASIEGEYTGLWRTTLRAGFETAEIEYANRGLTNVLEPTVNTTTLALRSRPRRDVKLQADYESRRVDERPLSFDLGSNPLATRIWSEADVLRVRGTWTPSFWPIGVTAGYRDDERKNPNQGTANGIETFDVTGWWQVNDDVNVTASYLDQDFQLSGIAMATPFVSQSESWQAGATWQPCAHTLLSASFARSDSFGAIELQQDTWSVSLDHEWNDHRVRLGFTMDDLDDYNGTLLGYDADLWYAEFSTALP
jgi:hypothetical protein